VAVADRPSAVASPTDTLDRWAAFLGTTLTLASLGLVALADSGWFRLWPALTVIVAAVVGAAVSWRPPLRRRPTVPRSALLAAAVLGVGTALIAPGSENIAGSRDPAVYVATGFAIARGGGTIVHDSALQLLATTSDPGQISSWLYNNAINGARIRFPAQLFIRDGESGTVEGGFLPVLPVWFALAAGLGGMEPVLHVAGIYGVLALAFVMLAARDAARAQESAIPGWPLVGALLAVSFSQVWWAREPMAEPVLGAFTWFAAWASVRWLGGEGPRWAALAGLATGAALFARADGVLLVTAVGLLFICYAAPGRRVGLGLLAAGIAAAGRHYALVATVYMSTTYGGVTAGRAAVGLTAVALLALAMVVVPRLQSFAPLPWLGAITARATILRRAAILALVGAASASVLTGLAPGTGRAAALGGSSPLVWLPDYVPWPFLVLALVGVLAWGWNGVPRPLIPLLLVGGLPVLLYLPDPLVTGDHPWMVRRLVPAVVPLLAVAASAGAGYLWRGRLPLPIGRLFRLPLSGQLIAALLTGLGLGLAVAQDRELVRARHGAAVIAGLTELAGYLPPNALVLFPSGQAGNHLALPLDMDFGIDAFALPVRAVTPAMGTTLARMEAAGRAIYWAEDGILQPILPEGAVATRDRTARIQYQVADNGPVPRPLQLRAVDHVITLYRLSFAQAELES
jgi:hypothetical protein